MKITEFMDLQLVKMSTVILNSMKNNYYIFRILYIGFTVLGLYRLLTANYGDAAMNFGIALAFDPFDQSKSWKDRPLWQRLWLIIHLAICSACLGFEIGLEDAIKK